MFKIQKIPLLLGGGVLTVGIFWFGLTPPADLLSNQALESTPDYFLEGVTANEFDANGIKQRTIVSEKLLHYADRDITLLTTPDIQQWSQDRSVWHASAENGEIKDGSKDILLKGAATVVRQRQDGGTMTLAADAIHYLENQQILVSEGNASVISAEGSTKADKIQYDQASEQAQLEGNVTGYYEKL